MNGADLFRLSRRLLRLGVGATPPGPFRDLPTSVRMVLVDVHEHPGSTIGQIVERTGFPQSHVSSAVARLRDDGLLVTETDAHDRRRTIVAPSPAAAARRNAAKAALPPIDHALGAALVESLGPEGAAHLPEAIEALETLARLLTPAANTPAASAPAPHVAAATARRGGQPC